MKTKTFTKKLHRYLIVVINVGMAGVIVIKSCFSSMAARLFVRLLLCVLPVFQPALAQDELSPSTWSLPGELPRAFPPTGMSLARLSTGITHRSAGFACAGGSRSDPRDFTMTAVLVRHPRGDLLIDTGFGRDIDDHFHSMPWWFQLITTYERGMSALDQFAHAKYDIHRLRAIILTHAHWDHVSGAADFPNTPIWVSKEELSYIRSGEALANLAKGLGDARFTPYSFEGGPYLGYPRSHDVYGDGSVVIVPSPGHTPGSVTLFVALPDGSRYAFIGDLVWQLDCLMQERERPFVARWLADSNPAQVRKGIEHILSIKRKFPTVKIVPAHDAAAFSQIPQFN